MPDVHDAAPSAPGPARPASGPRGWDALTPATRRFFFNLVRFGFLTAPQAARLDGRARIALGTECTALRNLGLLRTLRPTSSRGQHKIYTLAPPARGFIRALPEAPPRTRAALDRVDEVLAAVDIALELEAQGAGRWQTWAEHVRAHPPDQAPPNERLSHSLSPVGVLEEPGGRLRPVWVLLQPRAPAVLRRQERALCLRGPLDFGTVYALPELCEALEDASLHATVEARTPPHLGGRRPLFPGWWQVGLDSASPRQRHRGDRARVSDRPSLGPTPLAVLTHLDRFGHATAAQVARALAFGPQRAQAVLARLRRQGLAQCHAKGHNQPRAWSATRAGLAVIGSRRLPVPLEPLHRRHTLALIDLANDLMRQTGGTWETERELRTQLLRADRRHPPAPPDGRLSLPDGRRVGIQLQLTMGKPNRQYLEAWPLRSRGHCEEVWFLCAPEVAPAYRRAINPAEVLFIRVMEWVAPDHSAGLPETHPRHRR